LARGEGRGGRRTPRPGKKIGRPEKPKIEQFADKGIASTVLAMDGPPDHARQCECKICAGDEKKKCECKYLESDKEGGNRIKLECHWCRTREDHRVCRCEVCGWWEHLTSSDKRIRFETRRYLTDRREGKPAQGVFVGDTREVARELDFGDLPDFVTVTPGQPAQAGRPN
jgi:hypothetical protein